MDADIRDGRILLLAGLSFFGDPFSKKAGWDEENGIGRLWARFMAYHGNPEAGMPEPAESGRMYEAHIFGAEFAGTGEYEVFVGYPVADSAAVPVSLDLKTLPDSRMAWFTLEGRAIFDEDNYAAMERAISEKGMKRNGRWFCNVYDERFKGINRIDESVIDVCIPVR